MSDESDRIGTMVAGKYLIQRKVGTGGMGSVWLGEHTTLGTMVAIKFIHAAHLHRQDARRRFEIEAQAASRLKTPHVVQVFDYGTDDTVPYIVMEYLEGESLADRIEREGPVPLKEVALIFRQACRALSIAHELGIVHRDLKPDNLFLATNSREQHKEAEYVVKLVDFGIAKIIEDDEGHGKFGGPTRAGMVIGTPNFMCPEQLTEGGEPSPLSDLWSLGACAYTAAVGTIPFDGETMGDIVLKVCAEPLPVPTSETGNATLLFDKWYAKANHRVQSERFQTADDFARALDAACGLTTDGLEALESREVQYTWKGSGEAADPTGLDDDDELPRGKGKTFALVLGFLAMIGLVFYLAKLVKGQDAQSPTPASGSNTPSRASSSASH